jgi:hypothetical protein
MANAEFDQHAERYSELMAGRVAITGKFPEYVAEYKVRDIARALGRLSQGDGATASASELSTPKSAPAALPLRICDFGAGIGSLVPHFHRYLPGAELTCVDVSRRSLAVAEHRFLASRGSSTSQARSCRSPPIGSMSPARPACFTTSTRPRTSSSSPSFAAPSGPAEGSSSSSTIRGIH